jgi:uncharacterized protein (UPF0332 family)
MTLTSDEKKDLSQYRMEKADALLHDCEILIQAGSFGSSVSRAYYAVLSAAKGLLILRGIDPETHEGIKTMFSKEFIKPGLLPKEFGEIFRSIQARRFDSDYGDFIEIGDDEAKKSFAGASAFIQGIKSVIEKNF